MKIDDLPNVHKYTLSLPGGTPRNPAVIFALALNRALGDFIDQTIYAASVKRLFKHARLFIYYRNDRPYKSDILRLNPYVDGAVEVSDKQTVPVDFFDIAAHAPIRCGDQNWYRNGTAGSQIILTPGTMQAWQIRSFPEPAQFWFPDDIVEAKSAALIEKGLDPDRWFCTVHSRDSSYKFRIPRETRDIPPDLTESSIRYIVEELGGQVARLGHEGNNAVAPMPGLIDLSLGEEDFLLQAFAVSRARFHTMLAASGPATLGCASNVPTVLCNSVEWWGGLWNPHDMILPQKIIMPNGHQIPGPIARERGLLSESAFRDPEGPMKGYRLEKNSPEEIAAAVKLIFESTTDCAGWRQPQRQKPLENPPNTFEWPFAARGATRMLDFEHLATGYPVENFD